MLDIFAIFSKGGIVLWYFSDASQCLANFTSSVNAIIKSVILQERGGDNSYTHGGLTLKFKLDNEFELVFVVGYQKILSLSYVDKFLTDIQLAFRDRYKNELHKGLLCGTLSGFESTYQSVLKRTEEQARHKEQARKEMRSFKDSDKSKKTVGSMIESRKGQSKDDLISKKKGGLKEKMKNGVALPKENGNGSGSRSASTTGSDSPVTPKGVGIKEDIGATDMDQIEAKRELMRKQRGQGKGTVPVKNKPPKSPPAEKGGKQQKAKVARQWEGDGRSQDMKTLDFSEKKDNALMGEGADRLVDVTDDDKRQVGTLKGDLGDIVAESSEEEEEEEYEDVQMNKIKPEAKGSRVMGFFSSLQNLVSSKGLTKDDLAPIISKMRDHLIAKNVAAEVADQLCFSLTSKLEGKVLGTFTTVRSTVKTALKESCMLILQPKRRINILRDCFSAKSAQRPYVIVFCGVNGVGKSTNLAKVAFWLIENGLRVLVAACDTFRAGAVEQLKTHVCRLNALHPPDKHSAQQMIDLYQKGYGKDAAGIAMEAINHARDTRVDVVLVDTAGRMQDNEPLMRALAKLITVNNPDLTLFVGEALVGNDAVDQLQKFNQSLADFSQKDKPRLVDGIVLTKFDTIDDQVGAAISMTYITGQPIVFVGTGQTYSDLKNLNAKAVVQALLK